MGKTFSWFWLLWKWGKGFQEINVKVTFFYSCCKWKPQTNLLVRNSYFIRISCFLKYRCLRVIVPVLRIVQEQLYSPEVNCTERNYLWVIVLGDLSKRNCLVTLHGANCPRENCPSTFQKYVTNGKENKLIQIKKKRHIIHVSEVLVPMSNLDKLLSF